MSRSGYHHTDVMPAPKPKTLGSPILVLGLVVLAGIGYLCLTIPQVLNGGAKAKIAATRSDLKNIGDALDGYKLDMGRYPTKAEGLQALSKRPAKAAGWHGPYIQASIPKDPWGHDYVYEVDKSGFLLLSYGADGAEGGEGYAADISR